MEGLAILLFSVLAVAIVLASTEIRLPALGFLLLWLAWTGGWFWLRFSLPSPWKEALQPLGDAFLLLTAVWGGRALAGLVREAGMLAVVLTVAALVDLFGVMLGPVAVAVKHTPEMVRQFSVQVPQMGAAVGGERMVSLVGIGDFFFLGLLFEGVRRLGLDLFATTLWTVALMSVALVGVSGLGAALPGLLFICGAGLVANWRFFRFTAEERRALLIAGLLFPFLLLALQWGMGGR